jgi:hypothetical protein
MFFKKCLTNEKEEKHLSLKVCGLNSLLNSSVNHLKWLPKRVW